MMLAQADGAVPPPLARRSCRSASCSSAVRACRRSALLRPLSRLTSFCAVLFNYTILRDTKDVLVVTAPGSGAEIIPFLKARLSRAALRSDRH